MTIFLLHLILTIYQRERTVSRMAYTGLLLASLGSILILVIGWYILQVVAYWQIFEKAGEPGWKAIIPCYNTYTQYKFTWNANIYWFVLFGTVIGGMLKSFDGIFSVLGSAILLAVTIINIVALNKLSRAFGHGTGFTIGLFFLNPIFKLILGFGSDQYIGPQ